MARPVACRASRIKGYLDMFIIRKIRSILPNYISVINIIKRLKVEKPIICFDAQIKTVVILQVIHSLNNMTSNISDQV